MKNNSLKIIRNHKLAPKVVFVDGLAGCGKTMFTSIFSSMDNFEIMNYAFEIEFLCRLNFLGKISDDATIAMVCNLTDMRLYENMMSRNVNFRFNDLSSVFNNHKPLRYFKRLFKKGDERVPELIKIEKPILNFATHDLLQVGKPVFLGLKNRIAFFDIVRHPLFMVIQQTLNMERTVDKVRDINIYYDYLGNEVPFFSYGWENLYKKSNPVEKAIYYMKYENDRRKKFKLNNKEILKDCYLNIIFEKFVKSPSAYIDKIQNLIGVKFNKYNFKVMKKQNVPRKNIVDGVSLSIYKRCGWEPPKKGLSEREELDLRRDFVKKQGASEHAISTLDDLCREYENENQIFS